MATPAWHDTHLISSLTSHCDCHRSCESNQAVDLVRRPKCQAHHLWCPAHVGHRVMETLELSAGQPRPRVSTALGSRLYRLAQA